MGFSPLLFSVFFMLTRIDFESAELIDRNYSALIEKAVERYPYVASDGTKKRIDPALVKAVIYQESRGDPNAKSRAGAYGLTQIMPATAALLKCDYDRLNDPETAINCSVKFLAALLTYNKGDLVKSLSGYNGGTYSTESRPAEYGGALSGKIYDNSETKDYVVSVLRIFEFFKGVKKTQKFQ